MYIKTLHIYARWRNKNLKNFDIFAAGKKFRVF